MGKKIYREGLLKIPADLERRKKLKWYYWNKALFFIMQQRKMPVPQKKKSIVLQILRTKCQLTKS